MMELGSDGKLEVVCLQKHPEFIDQTIELLNNEWSRSKTARLRSIEQGSSESLPTSLILIDKTGGGGNEVVLAHCKISPVPSDPSVCFVESVVVGRNIRGKGFGRLIMTAAEAYVKQKGVQTVYLTTFDQQTFYGKLGYSVCDPIVVFGGRSQSLTKIVNRNMESLRLTPLSNASSSPSTSSSKQLISPPSSSQSQNHSMGNDTRQVTNSNPIKMNTAESNKSSAISKSNSSLPSAPPPPPPPPPKIPSTPPLNKSSIVLLDKDVKVTMRKILF